MKITVSIRESLSEEVKSVAKDLGVSPSKLIRTAVQDSFGVGAMRKLLPRSIARGLHTPTKSTLSFSTSFTRR
jgi:hypothetical protein